MAVAQILLVEDDQELRAVLSRGLAEEGFAVSGASTGAEAMERVCAELPDAVVIDVGLPDSDGRDLCQALRARGVHLAVVNMPWLNRFDGTWLAQTIAPAKAARNRRCIGEALLLF